MSKSSTMALAVGAGYLLGRKHKLRMAALLAAAAAAASGGGGMAGRAVRSGGKLLSSPQVLDKLPPEAAKIAGLVRSDLAQAGKAAAQAAVSSRIEGLTSALYDRADVVRGGGPAPDDPAGDDLPEAETDGESDAGTEAETDAGEPEEDERDMRPRAISRGRPAPSGRRSGGRFDDRPEPGRRGAPGGRDADGGRSRQARTRTGSAPVRRTGR